MKRFTFLGAIIVLLAGCSALGIQLKPSDWCAKIPAGSYSVICQISDKVGTSPEAVAATLKIANIAMLEEVYTARQADEFIIKLQAAAKAARESNGATYKQLVQYILARYKILSPKVQAALVVLDDFVEIDAPEIQAQLLSDYDWDGIEKHLADQRAIIAPFLM